jgi:uncharacterized protein (TIRG00374 family)
MKKQGFSYKGLLKWSLALLLLLWLYNSGRLEGLRDLNRLLSHPFWLMAAFLGVVLNYVFNFYRWKLLLKGIGIEIPLREIVRLSMIGQFFSIFMPGSVGGDLIKAVFVAKEQPQRRTDAVASILLDRVLGFLTLMSFSSIFFLLSFLGSTLPPVIQGFGLLLLGGTTFLLLVILLPSRFVSFLAPFQNESEGKKQKILQRLIKTLRAFARRPKILLWALGASILGQAFFIASLLILGVLLYGGLPWAEMDIMRFISASAVGVTASALPIAPMGIGVGQVAFAKVFQLMGAPSESFGIVIISAAQILLFTLNLSGAIWFLKSKKKTS